MSNINKVTKKARVKKVVNHEGATHHNYTAKEALATIIMTSFVSDKFYTTTKEGLDSLKGAIVKLINSDPEFVLKAAAYARQEGNMRTIAQVALVEALQYSAPRKFARDYAKDIMSRADEPTECLAYHLNTYGKPIPNILKRIVAARYEDFSEYELSKYQLKNKEFTLKDGILLTHPNLGEVGKKIIEGTASANTWEKNLSSSGVNDVSKKEAWETSIPKMGYMALLRNLRNMINEEIDMDTFKGVCAKISDPNQVKRSRQLPFRFYSAYREIYEMTGKNFVDYRWSMSYNSVNKLNKNKSLMVSLALDSISAALESSVHNLNISGRSLILCDSSGSMFSPVSQNSSVTMVEIGVLMGVCCAKISDASDIWTFDSNVEVVNFNRQDSILTNVKSIVSRCNGGATHFYKAMSRLVNGYDDMEYDNIFVFSDMQVYGGTGWGNDGSEAIYWKKYLSKYPNARMTSIDLNGYNRGNPFSSRDGVRMITGWSDKVIDLISTDVNSIVTAIDNYKIKNR